MLLPLLFGSLHVKVAVVSVIALTAKSVIASGSLAVVMFDEGDCDPVPTKFVLANL